ncbi:myb-like protein H isoform X2 [Leptopilina heterotoma]|uniref:myb-like protein H isoform X2 n=1 Tax=Leptopilina heterotoma TaxID=63436 RepID=UPI001CA848D0|nr:myb-like protein H isoform X2 [Leptopilina heterotoma]
MFCPSYENEKCKNEFGWWICETENISSFSSTFSSSSSSSSSIINEKNLQEKNSSNRKNFDNNNLKQNSIFSLKNHEYNFNINNNNDEKNEEKEKTKEIKLTVNVDFDKIQDGEDENFIENGFRKSHGFSYTPERLVKSKEYKILSPPFQFACIHSSKFRQRKLSELIDPNKIGGINLQKLLCPNIMPIEDYFHLKGDFDFHDVKNRIKEELKTLSEEKGNHKFSSSEDENTSGIQSPGWSLDTSSDPTKALPRVENLKGSSNEEEGLIFEDLEVESEFSTNLLLDDDDRENLSEIQSKVRRLQDVNEDMQKEIVTLKEDFQNDEWRVNILLEEAINYRRELQELQYLDNLVNLLRGELERISPKTWPFIRNHTDPYSDEINLII